MYYDFSVTIPANTAKVAATKTVLKLTNGIIHRVEIQFPAGCAGLAHCQISQALHQRYPTNPQGDFSSDDFIIGIDDSLEFFAKPLELVATCWNTDDTYPHTLSIRIGLVESKAALLTIKVMTGMSKFLRLMGVKI